MCREREENKRAREALERSGKRAKVSVGKASKAPSVQAGADVVPAGDAGGCASQGGGAAFGKVSSVEASKATTDVVPAGDVGGCASQGGAAAFAGGSWTAGCKECSELRMQVMKTKWEVESNVETGKLVQENHELTLRLLAAEHKSDKKELEAKNAALERGKEELEAKNAALEARQKELEALERGQKEMEAKNAALEARQKELEAANERLVLEKGQKIPQDELDALKQSLQSAQDALARKKQECSELERSKRVLMEENKRNEVELKNVWGVRQDLQRVKGEVAAKEKLYGTKCDELKTTRQELECTLKTLQRVKLQLQGENSQHVIKCNEFRASVQELQSVKLALGREERSHETKCKELKKAMEDLGLVKMQLEELEHDKKALMVWVGETSGEVVVARARSARAGASNVLQGTDGELQRGEQGRECRLGDNTAPAAGIGSFGCAPGAFTFIPDEQDGTLQRGEQGRESKLGDNTAPPAGIGSFGCAPGVGAPASKSVQHPQSKALCFETGYIFQRGKPGKSTNGKLHRA